MILLQNLKLHLQGAQEVPANPSTSTGVATITYNREGRTFNVEISYSSGFIPTGGNIHKGATGTNGSRYKIFYKFNWNCYFR
ncbi:MAG: CHRD domain-containing protein [Chitinophagaceae bacterium]